MRERKRERARKWGERERGRDIEKEKEGGAEGEEKGVLLNIVKTKDNVVLLLNSIDC